MDVMINNMQKIVSKNKYWMLLILLIVIQLFRVIYVFNFEKEGYHSDELWCYGLANSYYDPFIFSNGSCFDFDNLDYRHNFNEWLDGSVYRDYIEVGDNDRFAYGSVIYNQSKDQLPPFHYILLHTICSFFPNTFSMWYGLSINLFMLIFTNLFLYLLARKLFKSEYMAILTVGFYGFGIGALQTFMYIRMYATVTFFVVLLTYLHAKMLLDEQYNLKVWIALFIATALGGLTHYVFLFYAFFMAAFFCFFYLFSKKIKRLFFYATSMLAGVGGVLAVFPYAIEQLTGNREKYSGTIPSRLEIAYVINRTFMENTGIFTQIYHSQLYIYVGAIILVALLFLCAAVFICRNEEWLHRYVNTFKADIRDAFGHRKELCTKKSFFVITLLVATIAEVCVASYICNVVRMGLHSNRYLFCAYPCFCLLFAGFVFILIKVITVDVKKRGILMLFVMAAFVILSNVRNTNNYIFPNDAEGMPLTDIPADADVILAVSDDWLLVTYSHVLKDANKVINLNLAEYDSFPDIVKQLPDDGKDVYLIFDVSIINAAKSTTSAEQSETTEREYYFMGLLVPNGTDMERKTECPYTFDDVVKELMKVKGLKSFDYLGTEVNFGRQAVIYKLR